MGILYDLFDPWFSCLIQLSYEEYLKSEVSENRTRLYGESFSNKMFFKEIGRWTKKAFKNNWFRMIFFPFGYELDTKLLKESL